MSSEYVPARERPIDDAKARKLFWAVVKCQDKGSPPLVSYGQVAGKFRTSIEQVRRVVDQGIDELWPLRPAPEQEDGADAPAKDQPRRKRGRPRKEVAT